MTETELRKLIADAFWAIGASAAGFMFVLWAYAAITSENAVLLLFRLTAGLIGCIFMGASILLRRNNR